MLYIYKYPYEASDTLPLINNLMLDIIILYNMKDTIKEIILDNTLLLIIHLKYYLIIFSY